MQIEKSEFNKQELISNDGATSVVYLGYDSLFKQMVIKQNRNVNNPDFRIQFENEISIYEKLDHPGHPNIIKMVRYSTDQTMIGLEPLRREPFISYIMKNLLPEHLAKYYFKQMAEAVQYLHRQMIVHRDLKPDNTLLDQKYNLKIADFGRSVELTDAKQQFSDQVGTRRYWSPQQWKRKQYDGQASDNYALGVILFAFIFKTIPFIGKDEQFQDSQYRRFTRDKSSFWQYYQIRHKILHGGKSIDPALIKLFNGLLEENEDHRFTTEEILNSDYMKNTIDISEEERISIMEKWL